MKQTAWIFLGGMAIGTLACSDSGTEPPVGGPPKIVNVQALPTETTLGGDTRVSALASDPDQDPLSYSWRAPAGSFASPNSASTNWTAPDSAGVFTISVTVSDGTGSDSSTVDVLVGTALLTVESDPPEAFINLNGSITPHRTPHTFELPPGFHEISIFNPDWAYAVSNGNRDVVHGDVDTLRFATAPPTITSFDLGRSDFLEIGGIAFLPSGTGIIYSARTATGTGIFSSSLNPPTGTANGIKILDGVRVEEPVAVSGDFIYFISDINSLLAVRFYDSGADGLVDSVSAVHSMKRDVFSPAVSSDDRMAYTLTTALEPAGAQVLMAALMDTSLGSQTLATSIWGKLPSWEPGEQSLAFERDGVVYTVPIIENNLPGAHILSDDGFNTSPAWGPWGPRHVAWLRGETSSSLDEIRLAVNDGPYHVSIPLGASNPRFLAWSRAQKVMAVAENPGTGQVRFVSNLPIP